MSLERKFWLAERGIVLDLAPNPSGKPDFPNGISVNSGATELSAADLAEIKTIANSDLSGIAATLDNLSAAEIGRIDELTPGTMEAGKVVVPNDDVNIGAAKVTELHIGTSGAEVQVTATPAEINGLAGLTPGTAEASKPLVVDADKRLDILTGAVLYASKGKSAVLTELAEETVFDKSFPAPADSLKAGDVIVIEALVKIVSVNGTDDHTYKLYVGGNALVEVTKASPAADDYAFMTLELVVNEDGATGTAVAVARKTDLEQSGSQTWAAPVIQDLSSLDTTAVVTVEVKATHAANHADNQSRLEYLIVRRR